MAGKVVGRIKAILGLDKKSFDRGLDDAQQKTNKFSGAIKKLGGVMAGVFAVSQIVSFGKEVFLLAGKAEGVKAAFDKLNNPYLLDDLRRATNGTVTDLKLMQAAVKAKNFKIPLDQLASYFEFATKRAAETGDSVDYLVQSIIDGVGRKSSLVLDNLGISATELQAEIKKTGDFGAAAGAIMNRELAKMGDVTLTSAQKVAQLKTNWENLKLEIGQGLMPVLNKVLEWMNQAVFGLKTMGKSFKTAMINIKFSAKAIFTKTTREEAQKEFDEAYKDIWKGIFDFDDAKEAGKKTGKAFSKGFTESVKRPEDPGLNLKIKGISEEGSFDKLKEDLAVTGELMRLNDDILKDYKQSHVELAEVIETDLGERLNTVFSDTLTMADMMVSSIDSLSDAFSDMFDGSIKGFKSLAAQAVRSIGRIILMEKQRALAGMAGAEAKKGLLGLATMTIGFAAINGIFGKFAKMKEGGVVPPGFPNDTYPAFLSSGEVVTPPHKLPASSGGMQEELKARVSGRQLEIILNRWSADKNRIS